jgi:hypothetical protein
MCGDQAQQYFGLRGDGSEELRMFVLADQDCRKVLDVDLIDKSRRILDIDPDEANFGMLRRGLIEDGTVGATGGAPLRTQTRDEEAILCAVAGWSGHGEHCAVAGRPDASSPWPTLPTRRGAPAGSGKRGAPGMGKTGLGRSMQLQSKCRIIVIM